MAKYVLSNLCLAFAIFSLASAAAPTDRLRVYVVNYPLQYFAERIAAEHAIVVLPAPADVDPAFWMPDVKTIGAYQRADLILLNGAGYAKWVNKVTLPQFRRVDTSAGFRDRYIKMANVVTHTHGPTGKHAHAATAFTTWLDFDLAAQHAKAIVDALSRRQPARRNTFQRRYATLEQDLKALDDELKTIVSQRPRQPFVASHPVYDYLARRYGLQIKSVHWEPGELPTESQWAALAAILQDHPARWMIWEGKPHPDVMARLQSMGINSLIFDPLGHVPLGGDFLSLMRQNIKNLRQAFQ